MEGLINARDCQGHWLCLSQAVGSSIYRLLLSSLWLRFHSVQFREIAVEDDLLVAHRIYLVCQRHTISVTPDKRNEVECSLGYGDHPR